MGWVTLTLRKKELKSAHAFYQLRDLQLSREKRAMAREKQSASSEINNKKRYELAQALEQYNNDKQSIYDANKTTNDDGTTETSPLTADQLNELSDYQNKYNTQKDLINSMYDDEMAMAEEEAADRELELDMEQTDVEAQMEAISQEMSAVSDAISSEIQNSTIKLS